jgi:hypothetical protein
MTISPSFAMAKQREVLLSVGFSTRSIKLQGGVAVLQHSLSGDGFLRLALRSRAGESDALDPESFRLLLRSEIGAQRHHNSRRRRVTLSRPIALLAVCGSPDWHTP